jgi:hypothetical protein
MPSLVQIGLSHVELQANIHTARFQLDDYNGQCNFKTTMLTFQNRLYVQVGCSNNSFPVATGQKKYSQARYVISVLYKSYCLY